MISIIVAVAKNYAIGKDNRLLWHLSDDLKYFKRVTSGHPVVMGYNTFLSVGGRPFPNRRNIVVNNALPDGFRDGVECFAQLESALRAAQTPASGNSPASGNANIGIISDFHSYTPLPKRKEAAMDMIRTLEEQNGKDLDFILHVGDVCAWGASYSFWKDLYSEEAFSKYMWAGVNGNHDNMDRKSKKLSNVYFKNVNNNPLNGYKGEKGVCYFFKYDNVLFIMLNNEDMRTDEGLKEAQKWVRKVIKKNPARFTIVVEHYQWFYGNDGKTSQFNRWHELFEECGVDLAIAGNNHIYVRTDAINGTTYIQTPSSDNERGVEIKEWTDNKDIIKYRWSEGGNTVGALIMNFEENRIKVTLYDRNGVSLDEVRVE